VRRPPRLGLRARIVAAIALAILVTSAAAAVTLLIPLQHRLRNDQLRELSSALAGAQGLLTDLPDGSLRPGSAALTSRARTLARRTGAQAFIVDARGVVLATTDPDLNESLDDARRAIASDRPVESVAGEGDGEARSAVPVHAEGQRLAVVLHKQLGDQRAAVTVVAQGLVVAVLVGLAVALLVGILLAGRIVRRIGALRRTALQVAELGPVAEVMTAGAGTDEVGDLTRAFATMQDRLREQEEARRAFVATASHELRTPLAALQLTLDLAASRLQVAGPPAEAGAEQVQRAQGQAQRLARLADELLELSRLDAGVPMRRELVELGELARAVAAELGPAAAAREVEIALFADGPTWVMADPGAVARIARILVDNALRFSPAGGRIALSTIVEGDMASLSVRDEGPGVPEEERQLIFERFRRGRTSTENGAGFGLGLAIGRQLAEQMDGRLQVAAVTGSGACFVLSLVATDDP
jgi:signal transduction histidine kinase